MHTHRALQTDTPTHIRTLTPSSAHTQNMHIQWQDKSGNANISVDESTIRKTLNNNGFHGRTPRKKPLLSKKSIAAHQKFAKEHLEVPQHYWQYILWTDETTVELFGRNTQHCVEEKKAQHTNIKISTQPNCKVWWRGHHGLGLLCCLGAWAACYRRWKVNSQVYQVRRM